MRKGPVQSYNVEVPTAEYWQRQIKCQQACPVHTDARGYVREIAAGRLENAYLIARGPNPLASICGRVCGAPCEAACRRKDLDQAVSIRALKRFVADRFDGLAAENQPGDHERGPSPLGLIQRLIRHATQPRSSRGEEMAGFKSFLSELSMPDNAGGQRIAIIGSGPAGLAAAHDMALLGLRPTVYEMEPVPAGMLAVGIPAYRLPRDLIQAEVEFIRALGVEFVCNTKIGQDISLADIRKRYCATVIAIGMKCSRALPLPGSEGDGVLGGIELLRDVALGRKTDLQGTVVVIGGGNVAYDVARTVIRQTGVDISRTALRTSGVKSVHLCSLESLESLPADDLEILEGDEEGVIRHHGLGPKEILLREDGSVRAIVFQRCLRLFDEEGRFAPEFDPSDLTTLDADRVIWSIGQRPDLSFLESASDIEMTQRNLPRYDAETMRTTANDVFLAGDIAHGPKLLIDAVASGKRVARKVFEMVSGQRLVKEVELIHLEIPNYVREPDYEKLKRAEVPTLPPESRMSLQQGDSQVAGSQMAVVETGYSPSLAVCEGRRCLDCGVNTIFDSSKCILCGGCADVCPELCLELVSIDKMSEDALLAQALSHEIESQNAMENGMPAQFSAIIKDETKCIRCALCADRCPVGAITMERVTVNSFWSLEQGIRP